MRRTLWRSFFSLIAVGLLLLACESDGGGGGTNGAGCVSGATRACACTDGRAGAQVCLDGGRAYEDCVCTGGDVAAGDALTDVTDPDGGDPVGEVGEDSGGEGVSPDGAHPPDVDDDAPADGGGEDVSGDGGGDAEPPDGCAPDCTGLACGPDGCGGSCGACGEGQSCQDGVCVGGSCEPDALACLQDDALWRCDATGGGWALEEMCAADEVCSEAVLACVQRCDLPAPRTTRGCEFWTADLPQYPDPTIDATIVPTLLQLVNPQPVPASVTVEPGVAGAGYASQSVTVPAGGSQTVMLPAFDLYGSGIYDRGIRVRASVPIEAAQIAPFDASGPVYSQDASALLPTRSLGSDHVLAGWPTVVFNFGGYPSQHAHVTVIAAAAGDTDVHALLPAPVAAGTADGGAVPAVASGEVAIFTLQQGQVLNLRVLDTEASPFGGDSGDPTGGAVWSTQPVAVFTGHEQAAVGYAGASDTCCADHLEEQVPPLTALGTEIVCARSPSRGGEPDIWRLIAAANDVQIDTSPPQAGATAVNLDRGDWIELASTASFVVQATGPVMAAQYLVGGNATPLKIGDPSLMLTPTTAQYTREHRFIVPAGFEASHAVVVRPSGAAVLLDSQPAEASFAEVGSSGWERAAIPLTPGLHVLTGDAPIGVTLTGYAETQSYSRPASMSLEPQ
jgi:hypothetical protein